eukprot:1158179-Pelagomonas_calceolata.AAC.4
MAKVQMHYVLHSLLTNINWGLGSIELSAGSTREEEVLTRMLENLENNTNLGFPRENLPIPTLAATYQYHPVRIESGKEGGEGGISRGL